MYTLISERIRQWWAQNVVADGPSSEYTYLDRKDGLDTRGV